MTTDTALTPEQVNYFLDHGHVIVHDCFSREFAKEWTELAFRRQGYDLNDSTTWVEPIIHMPATQYRFMADVAPKAWAAACQLLGGEERVDAPCWWGDSMIVNFHKGADQPWQPPSPQVGGWHKDGDFFKHFLNSPEQGLLTIVIWSDIGPQGGGTFAAADSVPVIARYLAEHPEGVKPTEIPSRTLIEECHEFVELTGKVGDVVLIHPYVLHAASQNHSRSARFITNPPIKLKEPMEFDRPDGAYSPVEQAILNGLGVARYDFQPTSPREAIVPERIARQKKMLDEQQARLAAAAH